LDFTYKPHASYTHEVNNAAEFLKGPFAYTIVLFFEQRDISVSVANLRRIKHW